MSNAPGFRLRLYTSSKDYSEKQNAREINFRELIKEKYVFITGGRKVGKTKLLIELKEILNKQSKYVFFFSSFDKANLVGNMTAAAQQREKGFILLDDFMNGSLLSVANDLQQLTALVSDFPNFSFYIATDYNGYWSGESDPLSRLFKVAELLPAEEEIIQQKSEPVEEIKQQKSEPTVGEILQQQKQQRARPNRRSKQTFQPTTTKYDELFREVINSPELDKVRLASDFVLEEHRKHHRDFTKNLDNEQLINIAKSILAKLKSVTNIEEVNPDSEGRQLWNSIKVIVQDISLAYDFHRKLSRPTSLDVHYTFLELQWAADFLKMVIEPENTIVLSPVVLNYIFFFETPSNSPYIFDEDIKKKIVEKIFEQEYDTREFTPLLWGYFESLTQNNPRNADNMGYFVASVLLHSKIKAVWDENLQEKTPPPPPAFNDGRVIGQYSPDEASEIDHLGFKHDVHALAALIAYEKTPLPLAIGLFGNWGSGKSSFMKQLQKRVNTLSTEQYDNKEVVAASNGEMPYCSKIAHITFNAWHFSDANLWASMMVHIFDELLRAIVVEKDRADLRKDLLNNLSTAREALREAEKELQESKFRVKEAEQALAKEQLSQQDIDAELKKIEYSLSDVLSALMKDEQFKSAVNHTAKEIGYDKLIQSKDDLLSLKAEITDEGKRWKRAVGNLFRGNIQYSWFFLLLLAAPVFAAVLYKLDVSGIKTNISSVVVAVAGFSGWIRLQLKKFSGLRTKLEAIQAQEENKVRTKLEQREKELKEKLAFYQTSVQQKEKQVEIARQNEADAQKALDEIDINRQLTSFIRERQSGNNYQQHLGIISLIRKDFEALSGYLKTGRSEKKNKDRIIDRIVLYIDDLDRCKTERVVAVLEAVHLLLALDLFVVVVGVDPRWVSKALKEQYKEQLHLDAAEDSDTARLPGQRATPFDYLEKIFQVPFVLRSMDNSGAKKLLDNLFKDQVKKKEEQEKNPQPDPFTGPLNDPLKTGNPLMQDPFDEKNLTQEQKEAFKKTALEMEEELKRKKEQEEKEAVAKKEFIEQVENLTISDDELTFMKSIAPIIGATPRTVKRYGNLYRLLRVHSDLPNYSGENLPVYQSVMLLLSISVSNGSIARPFFHALKESKKAGFYEMNAELIEALKKELIVARKVAGKDEKEEEKEDSLHEQLQALTQLHVELGKLPDAIKNFSVATLKKYSPVVSRFSFRTLNCVEEEAAPAKA